ncbi:MAG: aconitate hydratase AcnA [Alphaproteobacteria bacterium]|nr:aconitate hydratase AcnA [Alphaproteobacteria bacterium]
MSVDLTPADASAPAAWSAPLGRLSHAGRSYRFVDLPSLMAQAASDARPGGPPPYSVRVMLDNVARRAATAGSARERADAARTALRLAGWTGESGESAADGAIALDVTRVVLPDSSGLPALMDLAALRDLLAERGEDPARVEPGAPVDVVIDHSLIVDRAGAPDAAAFNQAREYERNAERYSFFKWAQQAFGSVRVAPPGKGIIHQIHLEHLAACIGVAPAPDGEGELIFPEFVLGCDSHTPMVNALGVLAWGVGGIDAEAAMLGRPHVLKAPRVVGVRLSGSLPVGSTTTDLVLLVTQRLRSVGVVGDFVEFFGDGAAALSVPQRATLANMAPEYGATVGFFPMDARTLAYLRESGRPAAHVDLVEAYAKAAGLYRAPDDPAPGFNAVVEIDLADAAPCLAGPRRPNERVTLDQVKSSFSEALTAPRSKGGFEAAPVAAGADAPHGTLAIAAITSCTNTSNPSVMLAAGLLARKARARGLKPPAWVKTSLAPGSRVVPRYLAACGLMEDLEALGFHVVGFGCTTCSGKSGGIDPTLSAAARDEGRVLAAVLSGNRNFEARIHPDVRASYLGSPPLVVAFALAGRIDVDLTREPLGRGADGKPVHLADLWPSAMEIEACMAAVGDPALYRAVYGDLRRGDALWDALPAPSGPRFAWAEGSTYIRRPPFFDRASERLERGADGDAIEGARILCLLGDSVTTDHVTPSGAITPDSLAGRYLADEGVEPTAFNAYTQRRGNHDVMARATFSNAGLSNRMEGVPEGGFTRVFPAGEIMTIFEAAEAYACAGEPIVVLAGRNYGMGSSRDWAAKGPALLGVRAVIAESFERIHRANLVGMGILPLCFEEEGGWPALGLDGSERLSLSGLDAALDEDAPIAVEAARPDGRTVRFAARLSVAGESERRLLRDGGIFPSVLREFLGDKTGASDGAAAKEGTEG